MMDFDIVGACHGILPCLQSLCQSTAGLLLVCALPSALISLQCHDLMSGL